MRNFLWLLLFTALSFAQSKKYQGLLWEISGNGLEKPSYLYGSMHVSEKVSYHLSDAFFTHLLASDYVATESDPSGWASVQASLQSNDLPSLTYGDFNRKPISKQELGSLFLTSDESINHLLYRTSESRMDYQENTYLDLFIYQTGKKYGKKVIGLEDARKSALMVINSATIDSELDGNMLQQLPKLLKNRSVQEAMMDFYREKNLDMLDSLYTMATPAPYLKGLIYDRNEIMVKSIDSIIKKGSLFAAVGAAHLPGKKGLIEEFRRRGYKVQAVSGDYTQKGKSAKSEIENKIILPELKTFETADKAFSFPAFGTPETSQYRTVSADLTNGGHLSLTRLPLRDFLKKNGEKFRHQSLDSLFYEYVPGEIVERNEKQEGTTYRIDLLSRSKSGNTSVYAFIIDPLEVSCLSLSGKDSYVKQMRDRIFPSFKKITATDWKTTTIPDGYQIDLPPMHSSYSSIQGEVNAYDPSTQAYFFVLRQPLNDNLRLEAASYESEKIASAFATSTGATKSDQRWKIGENMLDLSVKIIGQQYYLMGSVNASEEQQKRFFDSFSASAKTSEFKTRNMQDEAGKYAVDLPESGNGGLEIRESATEDKFLATHGFEPAVISRTFHAPDGSGANLNFWEYHRYDFVQSRDSMWTELSKGISQGMDEFGVVAEAGQELDKERFPFNNRYSYKKQDSSQSDRMMAWLKALGMDAESRMAQNPISVKLISSEAGPRKGQHTWTAVSTCDSCSQEIRHKIVSGRKGLWWLKAITEREYQEKNAFIDTVFRTFLPDAETEGTSVFDAKFPVFLSDLENTNDSIKKAAIENADQLVISCSETPALLKKLESNSISPDGYAYLQSMLTRLIECPELDGVEVLEQLYRRSNTTSQAQIAILQALASQDKKKNFRVIRELLEYDIPLSRDSYSINSIFWGFADKKSRVELFPDIISLFSVPEYQQPVLDFLSEVVKSGDVSGRKLRKFRKMLLANARLEFKRMFGTHYDPENELAPEETAHKDVDRIKAYMNLLQPFRKETDINRFFQGIASLDIPELNLELLRLGLENDPASGQKDLAERCLSQPSIAFQAWKLLEKSDKLPECCQWNESEIAKAVLNSVIDDETKPVFLSESAEKINGKDVKLFFFETTPAASDMGFTPPKVVSAVAFLTKENGLDTDVYHILHAPMDAEKTTSETIEKITAEFENAGHPRNTVNEDVFNDLNIF